MHQDFCTLVWLLCSKCPFYCFGPGTSDSLSLLLWWPTCWWKPISLAESTCFFCWYNPFRNANKLQLSHEIRVLVAGEQPILQKSGQWYIMDRTPVTLLMLLCHLVGAISTLCCRIGPARAVHQQRARSEHNHRQIIGLACWDYIQAKSFLSITTQRLLIIF